jgi:hypothetical protein
MSVEDVNIDYYRGFDIKYIAIADILDIGTSELTLISATLSDEIDITQFVADVDYLYGEMDSTQLIMLDFASPPSGPAPGYVRDYVFEVTGRYSSSGGLYKGNDLSVLSSSNLLNKTSKPDGFKLHINNPNPFNPSTHIKFELKNRSFVKIEVYDILGQLVNVLANEFKEAGSYEVVFDGTNLPSGIYFYKMVAGNFVDVKKMVLLK